MTRCRLSIALAIALAPVGAAVAEPRAVTASWQPRDIRYPGVIQLSVDATDVERGIFRVRQLVPVKSGRLTLLYPKWVPGNHAPTARIERLAGLTILGAGKRLAWTRDAVDMHAFHVDVPRGVKSLELEFQFLSATHPDQGRVVATPVMSHLQWFHLALYPAGHFARQIFFQPSVKLPDHWGFTTQLPVAARTGSTISFKTVDFEVLMDSPIFAGRHFRSFDIGSIHGAPATLDVVADEPLLLDASPEAIETHRRLVEQAGKVFGPLPSNGYRFMVALTEELGGVGTEHLSSSENTRPRNYLTDLGSSTLLSHELSHAWNGKARRPSELWTPDFNQPMRNSMLWIYEGQAQFWAFVLSARSGFITPDQAMDIFARLAAIHSEQPGRTWRPLTDTGNDYIMSREITDEPWPSWHRAGNDSYTEGDLMWLKADTIIRELSGERRGLDDFARTFFAGGGERASLYDLDAVVAGLNRVQPYDWSGFLKAHLNEVAPVAPADWLGRSGYRLVFTDTPTPAYAAHHKRTNRLDLRHSLGLVLRGGAGGAITDVIWNSPAFEAGLVAGATILSVNGRKYDPELLLAAIQKNGGGESPIKLVVNSRNRERSVTVDYRGGLRFPRLERISGMPDRLGELLKPRP